MKRIGLLPVIIISTVVCGVILIRYSAYGDPSEYTPVEVKLPRQGDTASASFRIRRTGDFSFGIRAPSIQTGRARHREQPPAACDIELRIAAAARPMLQWTVQNMPNREWTGEFDIYVEDRAIALGPGEYRLSLRCTRFPEVFAHRGVIAELTRIEPVGPTIVFAFARFLGYALLLAASVAAITVVRHNRQARGGNATDRSSTT